MATHNATGADTVGTVAHAISRALAKAGGREPTPPTTPIETRIGTR